MRHYTFVFFVSIVIMICLANGCSPKKKDRKITGTEGIITSIESGNVIRLQNGLTVTLIGVSPSEVGKKYMETNYKGKNVRLVSDSRDPKQTYRSTATTVRAYAKLSGATRSINGLLLEGSLSNGLNSQGLYDSAAVFKRYLEDPVHPLLSKAELLSKIKPATFYIQTNDGAGTGFFINETGLALTNNHVLNNNSSEVAVAFFGENGTLDMTNIRPIKRIVFTYTNDDKIDFTIFEVEINGGEKTPYIPICRKHILEGDDVAKLGCPAGTVGNFQTGNLSNYNEGGYLTHSISSNHGDSGGPVVNFRGEAIGVNQSIEINRSFSQATNSVQKAEGIAYAVDIQLIKQLLDENHSRI